MSGSSNSTAKLLITSKNVSSALKNDKGEDAILKSFEVVDFLKPGEGYISYVTSVNVMYLMNERENSTSYVVKLNGGGEQSNDGSQKVLFEKEETILYQFLPLMNEILQECNQERLCIPVCYYSSLEPGREILFLEDMRARKFIKVKDELGLDVNHTKVIIKAQARLHAAFILLSKSGRMKNLEEKQEIMTPTYSKEKFPAIYDIYSPIYNALLENAADIADTSPKYQKLAVYMRKIAENSFEVLEKLLSKSSHPFKTLCQADCWVNNVMFRYDESGVPVECCLLDFQLSYYSSACVDLNYLLYTNLSGEVRKKNFTTFLTFYHDCYSSVFKSANINVEFDVNELHEELERYHFIGLYFTSLEVPLRIIESLDTPDLDLSGEDSGQKMRVLQRKFFKEIMASPKLKPRLFDSFDELLQRGILEKTMPV